jgi:penicillin-binding protein 1B
LAPEHGPVYSTRRLRIVVILLTLVTLPIVVGTSALIYYYLRFSTLVERRLQGERWQVPSRVYAQPLTVRAGQPLEPAELQRTLNNLKYDQRSETPQSPGEFQVEPESMTLFPRQAPGDPEPLRVVFAKGLVKEITGLTSKRRQASLTLEPELITYLFDDSREKRRLVRYEELPDTLIKAVLAIEDRRFFSHPGLDPVRILGAALRNLRADSFIQGGSTITQQLVKNFFLTPERTLRRKVQEALLALVLERRAGKQDILELYLNEIYLGQSGSFSINGVGEAARLYFNKDVRNLTLPEAALLAGMIQSPNRYHPGRHPKRAKERRDTVLRSMVEAGFVDAALAESAVAQPLRVERSSLDSAAAPYFVDLVRAQLAQRYDPRDLTTQNLRVQTTLDLHLQALATRALEQGLAKLEETYKKRKRSGPIQGSLIALEPRTGRVLALVGGRSYGQSQYNRVTGARRQPGSTFKPFVYLAAFEASFDDPALPPLTPATVVDDSPTVFFFEDKEYIPENYEDDYRGPVTLRRALALSLNVATVKVAEMVGYDRVAELWSKKMAMSAPIEPYPAVALGSFEATPLEMATAYTVLATGGLKVDPVTVLAVGDEQGRTLEQHSPPAPRRVVRPESAFLVTNMMRSVLNSGTAAAARAWGFRPDAAGKTGTTNDLRDAWFAGFTPELLCVVWVGLDDNTPLNLSGAKAALPIWVEFMKGALAGVKTRSFPVPAENIVFLDIDNETGLLAGPRCPKVISEAFVPGTEPQEYCNLH